MVKREMCAEVKNVENGKNPYVVARPYKTELWYYGRYFSMAQAKIVAEEVDGIILKDEYVQPEPTKHFCPNCKNELSNFDMIMHFCPMCMKTFGESEVNNVD